MYILAVTVVRIGYLFGSWSKRGCHETQHRPHRPQIQRYLTLNKQQK